MPVTVPTARSGSPPLEWKRTDVQHNAASLRPNSMQSSEAQLLDGSIKRIHEPQCPGDEGTGPRIEVFFASLSSASSSSSLSSTSSLVAFSFSSSLPSSISIASSSFLTPESFADVDSPVGSKPIAFFSAQPYSL